MRTKTTKTILQCENCHNTAVVDYRSVDDHKMIVVSEWSASQKKRVFRDFCCWNCFAQWLLNVIDWQKKEKAAGDTQPQ